MDGAPGIWHPVRLRVGVRGRGFVRGRSLDGLDKYNGMMLKTRNSSGARA